MEHIFDAILTLLKIDIGYLNECNILRSKTDIDEKNLSLFRYDNTRDKIQYSDSIDDIKTLSLLYEYYDLELKNIPYNIMVILHIFLRKIRLENDFDNDVSKMLILTEIYSNLEDVTDIIYHSYVLKERYRTINVNFDEGENLNMVCDEYELNDESLENFIEQNKELLEYTIKNINSDKLEKLPSVSGVVFSKQKIYMKDFSILCNLCQDSINEILKYFSPELYNIMCLEYKNMGNENEGSENVEDGSMGDGNEGSENMEDDFIMILKE